MCPIRTYLFGTGRLLGLCPANTDGSGQISESPISRVANSHASGLRLTLRHSPPRQMSRQIMPPLASQSHVSALQVVPALLSHSYLCVYMCCYCSPWKKASCRLVVHLRGSRCACCAVSWLNRFSSPDIISACTSLTCIWTSVVICGK